MRRRTARAGALVALAVGTALGAAPARAAAAAPVPEAVLAELRPGWFTQRFAAWALGGEAVLTLARGAALDGSYGAFAVLACTRPGARLTQLWRLIVPPAAYLRQEFGISSEQPVLHLYLTRLARKVSAALRK